MSGRFTQLGRQLRKLRNIIGGAPSADPVTTLRRATQLACDLACEHAGVEDAQAGFRELAGRGLLDPALADRIAAWVAQSADVTQATALPDGELGGRAMQVGRDLDRFLRSLEMGASAPEISFDALIPHEDSGSSKPESTAAVTISGRILELEVRGGRATVSIDEKLIAMAHASDDPLISFVLAAAPTSKPDVQREPTGVSRVVWSPEKITLELAPDFLRVRVL